MSLRHAVGFSALPVSTASVLPCSMAGQPINQTTKQPNNQTFAPVCGQLPGIASPYRFLPRKDPLGRGGVGPQRRTRPHTALANGLRMDVAARRSRGEAAPVGFAGLAQRGQAFQKGLHHYHPSGPEPGSGCQEILPPRVTLSLVQNSGKVLPCRHCEQALPAASLRPKFADHPLFLCLFG